uniref:Uncharacterized protein n=1 Tax=Photinus pyralis TaxID=7054 RepID=A0A1Y1JWC1_PHOPY
MIQIKKILDVFSSPGGEGGGCPVDIWYQVDVTNDGNYGIQKTIRGSPDSTFGQGCTKIAYIRKCGDCKVSNRKPEGRFQTPVMLFEVFAMDFFELLAQIAEEYRLTFIIETTAGAKYSLMKWTKE